MFASTCCLRALGFTVDPSFERALQKQRIGIFPHTSYIEVCLACLALWATGTRTKIAFCVARRYMEMPVIGSVLAYFGGFPVGPNSGVVSSTVKFLQENPDKSLAISPEGSLGPLPWKSGFFYIAKLTGIPIIIGGIDFANHTILCRDEHEYTVGPDDEFDKFLPVIQEAFASCGIAPLWPEGSNPKIILPVGTETSCVPLANKCTMIVGAAVMLALTIVLLSLFC